MSQVTHHTRAARRRLYIQLGRAGDILNILPLLHRDFLARGVAPVLIVQQDYAPLLEGVSYIIPVYFAGRFEDIAGAMQHAQKVADFDNAELTVTQIYGENLVSLETCSSFIRQSWERVPDAPAWGSLPLIFDRRDAAREQAVIELLTTHHSLLATPSRRPYVLISTDGISSPFEHSRDLKAYLRAELANDLGPAFDLVDLSGFHTDRFFDLLGLLEGAHALVTIDSGLLHLAHAVPALPVIALITREPSKWHGTAWRPQHIARFYYDECPDCFPDLARAVLHARDPDFGPRIYHVWSHFADERDAETARRMDFARATWMAEYELSVVSNQPSASESEKLKAESRSLNASRWLECEFKRENSWRNSAEAPIHDDRPMPFWRDLIDYALQQEPRDHDIIALTNSDSCFVPGLTGWVLDTVARHGAAYTHRWDFHKKLTVPLAHEAAVRRGEWYPGSDAFFFTPEWWRAHGEEYPDMILGREQNDEILRQLIKRHGGVEIPAAIYHEKHASHWEHHGRRQTSNGNRYNQKLAHRFFLKTGYRTFDPVWWQLAPEPAQRQWAIRHLAEH